MSDDGCEKCHETDDNLYDCCRCDVRLCETHTVFLQDFNVDSSDPLCGTCAIALICDRKTLESARHSTTMLNLAQAEKHCYSLFD
jgi:hypothetical protein